MSVNYEQTSTNEGILHFTVAKEDAAQAKKQAFNRIKKDVSIPGFRKGKVNYQMFVKMFGEQSLIEDAVNIVLPEAYTKAVEESGLEVVTQPRFDIKSAEPNADWELIAYVATKPEVKLGQYKNLTVAKQEVEVTEEEINDRLSAAQANLSELALKEGAAETGDTVVIDYEGFQDGEAFAGGKGENHSLELGSNSFIPGFEDQLVGVKEGDEVEVNLTFPEEYHADELAGKDATFKVKVHEVKTKEVPELDDEFAKDVSAVDTFAELKENLEKTLEKNNDEKAEREFEEAVITAVIENSKMDIPEVMVNKEIDAMMQDLEGRLKYQGLSLEQYMEFTGNTTEKMRDFMKENAERKVKADLVLEAIAKTEEIKATEEELNARALELGKIYGPKDPEKMAKILVKSQRNMIEKDIILENTLKFLKENCK